MDNLSCSEKGRGRSVINIPGEDALIAKLAAILPTPRQTALTIGDDAAAIELPGGKFLLVTTDVLMEGVHFRLCWGDIFALGWKALEQNLSDIAAMGGVPTHAVIGLAIPPGWDQENAFELYQGIAECARTAGVDVVGGDTITSAGPLTISVTVLGETSRPVTRYGACPGDAIYITGTLGRAAAGLIALESNRPIPLDLSAAVEAQMRPTARLSEGKALGDSGIISSMMDLSDGVATDLNRLCRRSRVGAVIYEAMLPVDEIVGRVLHWVEDSRNPIEIALNGGEDFELIFTAPEESDDELRQLCDTPITKIGEITTGDWVVIQHVDGSSTPLHWGFTHPIGA
jgi:thiamine-monophosphate kinase